jgi:two-component system LytT family response regulator
MISTALRLHGADLLAVALVFVAYTLTLWSANRPTFPVAVGGGVANTIPVVIGGLIVRRVIVTRLLGKGRLLQAAGHAVLCLFFSFGAYWLLIVLLGVGNSPSPWNFVVKNFVIRGMSWQLLENVTTYGVIAALVYARAARPAAGSDPVGQLVPPAPAAQKDPSRFLVRTGDEIRPIDFDRVVSIAGADDYAELSTLDGKRLVAMTLAEFEATLDPARFVRVHRSRIVNLDFVDRAEPAGAGRLLVHMRTGEKVSTSRAGAKLLKSRVI